MKRMNLPAAFRERRDELAARLGPRAGVAVAAHELILSLDDMAKAVDQPHARPVVISVRTVVGGVLESLRLQRPAAPPPPERTDLLRRLRALVGNPPPGRGDLLRRLRALIAGPPPPVKVVVDVDELLGAVEDAFAGLDRAVMVMTDLPAGPVPWHEDRDLVALLHDLLSAGVRERPDLALRRIQVVEETLRMHRGIDTVRYDPDAPDHDGKLFNFPRGSEPGDPGLTTYEPALLVDGQVIRRGKVTRDA
ncbi:hypothetical protein [Nonomuraea zeae]|uniref:Uncharacterized protein n=1 Tax=Nonomuraea zeae TaxID=1642303 RepID=A0A5S4G924_9ACTN|nr:hypothetical protein [Nonomuraea zeae]TMR29517.1 hypothetical protein ETD85_32215 [Nonomuraea zeae]